LKHIVAKLHKALAVDVQFAEDCIGEAAQTKANSLKNGEVLLLENLRFHSEEENGDVAFAEKLAELGDVYVNDAFGTAHRVHAYITVISNLYEGKRYCGYLIAEYLTNAGKVCSKPERPFTAIMGGAKVSYKIRLMDTLLDKVDNLIIGGG